MQLTSSNSGPRILVAEDEPEVRSYLEIALRCQGYSVEFAEDGREVMRCLHEGSSKFSLVLLDIVMPHKDGLETLGALRKLDATLPVIMLSGSCSPLTVVDAMKLGASDFLAKPVSHEDLSKAIKKALRPVTQPDRADPPPVILAIREEDYVGCSTWPKKTELLLKRVGSSEVPVLLQGETGVGKEVLARQLHMRSPRAKKPFLKLNCAALPAELVESELFGYERGAFTGAFKNYPGKFEMADGGTILLDEIGDMDFKIQAKLLQVLQDHEFLRLGSKEPCRVDVRVMAATHCDLEQNIRAGKFRQDLYYRLNVVRIEIPPLRERKDEVLPLVHHFMQKHATAQHPSMEITAQLQAAILEYEWPGNIRELENMVRRLLVLRHPKMLAEELRPATYSLQGWRTAYQADPRPSPSAVPDDDFPVSSETGELRSISSEPGYQPSILGQVNATRRQAETEAILDALQSTLWNRKRAAAVLNIDYKALLYKMKKLGIGEKSARAAV